MYHLYTLYNSGVIVLLFHIFAANGLISVTCLTNRLGSIFIYDTLLSVNLIGQEEKIFGLKLCIIIDPIITHIKGVNKE